MAEGMCQFGIFNPLHTRQKVSKEHLRNKHEKRKESEGMEEREGGEGRKKIGRIKKNLRKAKKENNGGKEAK